MRRSLFFSFAATVIAVGLVAAPAGATYPGDNGRISYSQWEEPEVSLRTVRPNGDDRNVLADGAVFHESSWSPNGRWIVYVKGRSSFLPNQLWVMRADGTDKRKVFASDDPLDEIHAPSFLPSGKRVVYTTQVGRNFRSYTIGVDGKNRERVAPGLGGSLSEVAYDPTGRRLAFRFSREGSGATSVYSMKRGGGGLRRLTDGPRSSGSPDWSPDGERLLFSREGADGGANVFRMRRDGSNQQRLSNCDGPVNCHDAVWSPNGRWVLYARYGSHGSIRKMRPDGTNDQKAVHGGAFHIDPSWQPLPN